MKNKIVKAWKNFDGILCGAIREVLKTRWFNGFLHYVGNHSLIFLIVVPLVLMFTVEFIICLIEKIWSLMRNS